MRRHPSVPTVSAPTMSAAIGVVTILLLASCSGDDASSDDVTLPEPATTVPAAPDTTAPPATTTTDHPTTTAATTTSTTSNTSTTAAPEPTVPETTTPTGPSSETAAFLIGGEGDVPLLPLGWWDGSDWRVSDDAFPLAGGETAVLTSVDGGAVTGTISLPTGTDEFAGEACFDGQQGFDVDVELGPPDVPGFGYSTLAVVAPWDVTPRTAEAVGLDVVEYRDIGAALADGLGGDGSLGEVSQVLRVDLDGDGVDEVLVTFEYIQESILGAAGDYSIVYLRSPDTAGDVVDTVMAEWLVDPDLPDDEFPFLLRSRVMAVADLDGDGTMEVALHRWYYEGASVEAYRFSDELLAPVAGNGCGS